MGADCVNALVIVVIVINYGRVIPTVDRWKSRAASLTTIRLVGRQLDPRVLGMKREYGGSAAEQKAASLVCLLII